MVYSSYFNCHGSGVDKMAVSKRHAGEKVKRRTPLKRTRINPMSKQRQKESIEYKALREEFLKNLPVCEVCQKAKSTDTHHVEKRGKNYLRAETWLAACRPCHDKIHREPKWARQHGYLK